MGRLRLKAFVFVSLLRIRVPRKYLSPPWKNSRTRRPSVLNGVSPVTAWPKQWVGQVCVGSETAHDNFNFGVNSFWMSMQVFEFLWSLWVFSRNFSFFESYINFSLEQIFFRNFHEVYEYFRNIDFYSLIAWRSVDPLKSWEFFVHVRNESTIWTIWIVQKFWIF